MPYIPEYTSHVLSDGRPFLFSGILPTIIPQNVLNVYGIKIGKRAKPRSCLSCRNKRLITRELPDVFCECFRRKTGINRRILVSKNMVCDFWNIPTGSRDAKKQAEWARQVCERDNYTCQKCGNTGVPHSYYNITENGRTLTVYDPGIKIHAHHIKPVSRYPKLAWAISNGITLCDKCHSKVHKNLLNRLPENQRKGQ